MRRSHSSSNQSVIDGWCVPDKSPDFGKAKSKQKKFGERTNSGEKRAEAEGRTTHTMGGGPIRPTGWGGDLGHPKPHHHHPTNIIVVIQKTCGPKLLCICPPPPQHLTDGVSAKALSLFPKLYLFLSLMGSLFLFDTFYLSLSPFH